MNADRLDMPLLGAWFVLCVTGVVFVASASAAFANADMYLWKHLAYLAMSAFVLLGVACIPLRVWEFLHRPCLIVAMVLLVAVLLPFLSHEVNGSRRWISLGLFNVQPAEIAKLLTIVYLAGYIARSEPLSSGFRALLRPIAWIGIALLLIIAEPDFGSVVVVTVVTGGVLFIAGARLTHFLALAAAAALGLAAIALLAPYRLARLTSFLDPWAQAFGQGYQLSQALISYGRGEIFGTGLGEGVQKLSYLPEPHNDFIFAVVAEELGLVGALVLLVVLLFVAVRMLRIGHAALMDHRLFAGCVAYGAGLLIAVQTLFNVGVNLGVLPTKGLTLPFISYGGNSLIVCSALVALALRVRMEAPSTRALRGTLVSDTKGTLISAAKGILVHGGRT